MVSSMRDLETVYAELRCGAAATGTGCCDRLLRPRAEPGRRLGVVHFERFGAQLRPAISDRQARGVEITGRPCATTARQSSFRPQVTMSRRDHRGEKWDTRTMEVTGHGIGGYRSGCRCAACRSAETQRKRDYRARRGGMVVAISNAEQPVTAKATTRAQSKIVGSVEQAVLDETELLTGIAERPSLVAGALCLARVLDNDLLISMHPQTARQLQAILRELHCGTKKKSKGRLASVQQMTRRSEVQR